MNAKRWSTGLFRAIAWFSALGTWLFLTMLSGCGSGTPQTSANASALPEAYDEYTEALTDAVIESPSGVVTIGTAGAGAVPIGPVGVGSASGASSGGEASSDAGFLGGEGGIPTDGGGATSGGFGQWHFDDCSPSSHFLLDSSGEGATAQHALNADCVPGISGLGVEIRSVKDVITVPDEPQFTVGPRVAVAAWVFPNEVNGDQPIVIKRLDSKTSFSLGIHKGNIEMSIVLTTGTTYISSAPIPAGTWSHVAGMFDGTFLYLFLDGQQFGQVYAAGTIRDVFAPIRIGATSQTQHFDGVIDEVFVSTESITKDQLTALACISRPSTFTVNPPASGPVPFDTAFHFDISVSNNDVGFCAPNSYFLFFESSDPTISTQVDPPGFFQSVPSSTSVTFGTEVTATDEADVGVHPVDFVIQDFGGSQFEFLQGALSFQVAQPTGCFVSPSRELMILDVSVVDDPVRAPPATSVGTADAGAIDEPDSGMAGQGPIPVPPGTSGSAGVGAGIADSSVGVSVPVNSGAAAFIPMPSTAPPVVPPVMDGDPGNPSQGIWTFGHLMRELAPSVDQAPAMTEALFDHWLANQTVNGFTVAARPTIQQLLLDIWPRTPDGGLDLDNAPLRLQAIVSRVDLRNVAQGSAGEGRFVFAVNDAFGFPQQFTVILEYNLPAKSADDVSSWANLWHSLSSHPFPSEEYNAALESITRLFIDRNDGPGAVNGSALLTLRTNEIALSGGQRWELREFQLSPATNLFDEVTVKETPDLSFNETQTFADFVNANAAAIEAEVPGANDNTVPPTFEGKTFLAGSVFNDLVEWAAPGILSDNARFHASLNTCNGCHGPETNTSFLMVNPRFPGTEATLSAFLTGTTVVDPAGTVQTLNDLARRKADLTSLVCPSEAGSPPPPATDAGIGLEQDAASSSPGD
jgi:hypothetical protein